MATELEQPGKSVLDEQNRLAEAVRRYDSTLEIDLARANVLEVMRVSPATTQATWQMMLSALRSRRAVLEFRSGSMREHAEPIHELPAALMSSQEPSAADLSR